MTLNELQGLDRVSGGPKFLLHQSTGNCLKRPHPKYQVRATPRKKVMGGTSFKKLRKFLGGVVKLCITPVFIGVNRLRILS